MKLAGAPGVPGVRILMSCFGPGAAVSAGGRLPGGGLCGRGFAYQIKKEALRVENAEKYMIFKLNGQFFGIEVQRATSIERMREITEIPGTEKYIKGLISLRGEIVPVIDLKERLSLPKKEISDDSRILITRIKDIQAGLMIDEAVEVCDIASSNIDSSPGLAGAFDKNFIRGVVQDHNRLIIILNLQAVLDIYEEDNVPNAVEMG